MINRIIKIFQTNTDYTFRIDCVEGNFQADLKAWFSEGMVFNTTIYGRIGIHVDEIIDIRNDYKDKCITIQITNFEKR